MCGGSFMSGIAPQIGQTAQTALGGGANPLQSIGTGGMGLGGMPAPMQNPFLGGSSGGGMSQPMPAGWEPKLSSVNTTTTQDIMGRGSSGVPFGQAMGQLGMGGGMGQPMSAEDAWRQHSALAQFAPGTDMAKAKQDFIASYSARQGTGGAGISPEMLQKTLQGNPFQPQQITPQQQRMMDRFNSKMQPYQQQMQQLQQQYMGQPPQALQQMQQQLIQMPEYQAMQKAMQSGNFAEANRLQQAFEASPQFQQMQQASEAFNQQQLQASQKMQADPRFNQLQNQMQQLQQRFQPRMQQFQPQIPRGADDTYMPRPQVLPAQPRQQVLPSQSLGAGIAGLLNKGLM